ncbi:ABC transporter ATP-binding protein [Ornithinimicrobium sp. Y1694]|uniref:ABC transporter ATP-binding protein n=1 Tax=Ornithinimicrobium sp. Y1694 TaxID=3418590 RepID=UPI003CEECA03
MTVLDASLQVDLGEFDLDLDLRCGQGVTALLGANGSGKTTALKALAGLHQLTSGHVHLGADEWAAGRTHLPPEARSVGMVLADPLLFPHLSLLDNVAYGPRSRGMPRRTARARAAEELARVGLSDLAHRKPAQVSQGQAQRASLARALATDPELLLLDEPLSALDPETRSRTRADLAARLRSYPGVTVLVTHDALDALTLADHLVFLDGGRVTQTGTPAEIVARPRNAYVAGVVGLNLLSGTLATDPGPHLLLGAAASAPRSTAGRLVLADAPDGAQAGDPIWATIAPEAVALFTQRPHSSARNVWQLSVDAVTVTGPRARVHLTGEVDLVAEVTLAAVAELGIVGGTQLWATVKATEVTAYRA